MLLDLIFPKTCLGCGKWGAYICVGCQKKLDFITRDACLYCQEPSYLGFTHKTCREDNGIDGVMSIVRYNPTNKKIIKGIKYRLVKAAFRELFASFPRESLQKFLSFKKLAGNVFLQPIPLHPDRYARRGFNQSAVCALYFQTFLEYPIISKLRRVKNTLPQAQTKSKLERQTNIKSAFQADQQSGVVVLIDDVITSGYTCFEAAKELKKQGARLVFVFTIARG